MMGLCNEKALRLMIFLIKTLKVAILVPLFYIIKLSLSSGEFLEDCKFFSVYPAHKVCFGDTPDN